MTLRILTLAAVAAGLAAAPAQAAIKTTTHEATGLVLTLDGATLTVTPGPTTTPRTPADFEGHALRAVCTAGLSGIVLPQEAAHGVDVSLVGETATWAHGAPAFQVTFPRDISATAEDCEVGRPGTDVLAHVTMDPAVTARMQAAVEAQQRAVSAAADRRLTRAARSVRRLTRDGRLPPAPRLVGLLQERHPATPWILVERVADVRVPESVYVVALGMGPTRVKLAVIDAAGRRHVLHVAAA